MPSVENADLYGDVTREYWEKNSPVTQGDLAPLQERLNALIEEVRLLKEEING